jgi:hypothetical protein
MNYTLWDRLWEELNGFVGGVLMTMLAIVLLGYGVSREANQHNELPKDLKVITATVMVEGCEYLASPGRAINTGWQIVSHKGNCTNKLHGNVAAVEK